MKKNTERMLNSNKRKSRTTSGNFLLPGHRFSHRIAFSLSKGLLKELQKKKFEQIIFVVPLEEKLSIWEASFES